VPATILPADLSARVGSARYYRERHDDFIRRHATLTPPPYYLACGEKYFLRFQALSPRLSDRGRAWVDRTSKELHRRIERRRAADPIGFDALERNPRAFRRLAYATHPEAYIDGGFARLPLADLLRVATEPDVRDLVCGEGIAQILRAARGVIDQSVTSPLDMRQQWRNLTFCSWRLPADRVRKMVPPELELDLRDGAAWVTLVPFEMAGIGLARPRLPLLRPFAQVNLRTYVRHRGGCGVFFFSIHSGHTLVNLGAQLLFRLPYRQSSVVAREHAGGFSFASHRSKYPAAALRCWSRPVGRPAAVRPGSLEAFLLERYALFTVDPVSRRIYRGEVRHDPWLVQPAEINIDENTVPAAVGLSTPRTPDHVTFSRGVEAKALPFVRVR
jgi:uncharacterized protein YqjF (DUF2071 family)